MLKNLIKTHVSIWGSWTFSFRQGKSPRFDDFYGCANGLVQGKNRFREPFAPKKNVHGIIRPFVRDEACLVVPWILLVREYNAFSVRIIAAFRSRQFPDHVFPCSLCVAHSSSITSASSSSEMSSGESSFRNRLFALCLAASTFCSLAGFPKRMYFFGT